MDGTPSDKGGAALAPPISSVFLPQPVRGKEKDFLLAVKRGDAPCVQRLLREGGLDINCVDPLGRSALTMAIENENLDLVHILVDGGVEIGDSLLHAIDQGFIEAVEFLLDKDKGADDASREKAIGGGAFAPEMTPLVLAAHRNHYEIVRLLLDRGISIPVPHDVRCDCEECVRSSAQDSIRHSRCRLSAYRALVSPCLLALATRDPLLTAFELSGQLERLSFSEPEFKQEYLELRQQCQQFAVDLLDQARSSHELKVLLNYDSVEENKPVSEDSMELARLKLAIKCKQKKFVSHPNVQQLLSALWFEGLPGFRRRSLVQQCAIVSLFAALFPLCATCYLVAPTSTLGRLMRKPFIKFLMHSSSYLFFLFLLILASQDFETFLFELLGISGQDIHENGLRQRQRGNPPTINEWFIFIYVIAFVWEETKSLWSMGFWAYATNMWNFIDLSRISLYVLTIVLRATVFILDRMAIAQDPLAAYIPREEWDDFDMYLIAEGLFAAANVFSALKLIHIFSVNPYLGPLQISLGRMVVDITKFFFFYTLVLFSFACGLTQLLSYYAALERDKCHVLPGGLPDWANNSESCYKWRRFANLFEACQSLFWASFGSLSLSDFELTGLKTYTRFWGLLMFGSYSVINVIVLLNLLIAMMNNSYNTISERSDMEWKFARTKLWLSYFAEGGTVPPPFNIVPRFKVIARFCGCKTGEDPALLNEENISELFHDVTRTVVWRYLVEHQSRLHSSNVVTEDHVDELKQDIGSFRYDLFAILRRNGMSVPMHKEKEEPTTILAESKRKMWERLLSTDFSLSASSSYAEEKLQVIVDKWRLKPKSKGGLLGPSKDSQNSHARMEDPAEGNIEPITKGDHVAIDMEGTTAGDDGQRPSKQVEEKVDNVDEPSRETVAAGTASLESTTAEGALETATEQGQDDERDAVGEETAIEDTAVVEETRDKEVDDVPCEAASGEMTTTSDTELLLPVSEEMEVAAGEVTAKTDTDLPPVADEEAVAAGEMMTATDTDLLLPVADEEAVATGDMMTATDTDLLLPAAGVEEVATAAEVEHLASSVGIINEGYISDEHAESTASPSPPPANEDDDDDDEEAATEEANDDVVDSTDYVSSDFGEKVNLIMPVSGDHLSRSQWF